MDRFVPDSAALGAIILDAPAWALIGLATRDPRLRQRAAQEIAETVLDRLDNLCLSSTRTGFRWSCDALENRRLVTLAGPLEAGDTVHEPAGREWYAHGMDDTCLGTRFGTCFGTGGGWVGSSHQGMGVAVCCAVFVAVLGLAFDQGQLVWRFFTPKHGEDPEWRDLFQALLLVLGPPIGLMV